MQFQRAATSVMGEEATPRGIVVGAIVGVAGFGRG